MKIQCDFCTKQEATVFCLADEAALCDVCDQRVHQANKLASRHKRFWLLDPSSSRTPLCDICQDRRALIFCQQDRTILCRDCNPLTHQANEHTQNHNRFLLVGINLSTTARIDTNANSITKHHESLHPINQSCSKTEPECYDMDNGMKSTTMDYCGGSASTISEYLTKILPGWKVEDLLDSVASPPRLSESRANDVGVHGRVGSFANQEVRVPEAANLYSIQDQQRALAGKIDVDLQRKMKKEKLIGSRWMESSKFQKSDPCVGFKRKRPFVVNFNSSLS